MRCQLAVIADAANLSQEGKLNILGEFDTIYSHETPVLWPSLVFAAKVEISEADGPKVEFEVRIVTEDGALVFRASIQATLQRRGPADGEKARVPILLPIRNAMFQQFGTYSVELLGNGMPLLDIPVHVRLRQAPPSGAKA